MLNQSAGNERLSRRLAVLLLASLAGVCATASSALAAGPPPVSQESATPEQPSTAEVTAWSFNGGSDLPEVPEPSGLCYCPPRDTLFVVDDGGPGRPASVAELDLNAKVLQQQAVGKDLEGVCYCPLDGMLYVCDEDGERVYAMDPTGLKLLRQFTVSRGLNGEEYIQAGGNGFEGIEYVPQEGAEPPCFILVNQDDPHCLVRIDAGEAMHADGTEVALQQAWPLPEINAGELYYDPAANELWVVHSWTNLLEVLNARTMQVLRWEVFPGCAQEGVALDGQGRLWIGSDTGGLARYLRAGASR